MLPRLRGSPGSCTTKRCLSYRCPQGRPAYLRRAKRNASSGPPAARTPKRSPLSWSFPNTPYAVICARPARNFNAGRSRRRLPRPCSSASSSPELHSARLPRQRPAHGLTPAAKLPLPLRRAHFRQEAAIKRPASGKFLPPRPNARTGASEPGGAQRSGLQHRRPVYRRVENVGKALHGPIARHHSAVDAQDRCFRAGGPVLAHGIDEILCLESYGFECGAGELCRTRVAGQPEDGAARLRVPPGCAKSDEGGHEIDILSKVRLACENAGIRRLADNLQSVAKPLHRSPRHEDGAFKRVCRLAAQSI